MLWRWRWKVTVEAFLFYFSWTAASLPLESSHLKYCKEPLSDLSPIDHSSRQSHKSPLLPLQMELCQLHNTNGIQAEKKNKKLRTRCCVKRYPPLSIPCIRSLLIWSFLSPGGTYSVPDVHYHPPPPPQPLLPILPPHFHSNSRPPACDLRQARGWILGNFSLTSYTVDCGAFLRWGKVTAPTLQGRASQLSGSAVWKSLMNSH